LCAVILAFHRRPWPLLVAWMGTTTAAVLPYAIGFTRPADLASPWTILGQPQLLAAYVGNYLSGPLGRPWTHPGAFGYAVALIFAVLAVLASWRCRERPALVLPWVMLGLFAIANAVLTGLGRAGLGVEQALTSRYVTVALLLPVAIVPLGLVAFRGANPYFGRSIKVAAAALTLVVVIVDYGSVAEVEAFSRRMKAGRDCVRAIEAAPDACLNQLHPNPAVVRRAVPELRRLGLSLFARE
jgi:hypothetical protein